MSKGKILYYILVLPFLFFGLFCLLLIKDKVDKYTGHRRQADSGIKINNEKIRVPYRSYVGEKITYDVKMGKLYLGKAWFTNLENEELNGRLLDVMTMETKLSRFTDTEKIYSDIETLLPVRVERNILKLLIKEKITEDYDQKNFTVTIVKNKIIGQEKLVIKKDGPIHNAVLLPYYVRNIPGLNVGKVITANLPTRKLVMKLVSIEEVTIPAGTFKAYYFKSTPKQIEIWISTDERKIPLKIQETGLFPYSMEMDEYSFDPKSDAAKAAQ